MRNNPAVRRSMWGAFKELTHYLWPSARPDLRRRVIETIATLFLAKGLGVAVPLVYKKAVDVLGTAHDVILVVPIGLVIGYGLVRFLSQLFNELRDFLFERVGQYTQRTVGVETFQRLHELSLAFHLDRQTGGLSRAIERGTRGMQFFLRFMVINILPTILEIVLVAVILFFMFGVKFSFVIVVTLVVYIAFTLIVTEWRTKHRVEMNQKDSEANTKAIDSLLNFETVKYFTNEEHERRRFEQSLLGYERSALKSQVGLSLLNLGQAVIIMVGLVWLMILAAQGVSERTMTVGDFVALNTYLMQLYLPLNFLGFVYREMKQGLVDMDKLFELRDTAPDVCDSKDAPNLKIQGGEVVFDSVNFYYRADRKILRDVSFRVPPGRKVAVVGPSGSGKSTIARLLFRFYDIQSGSIRIDGQDVKNVRQTSLRRAIGVVPQDTVLFNDTIEYNIRYGRTDASESEVREAAALARIHEFVMSLPQKYDTIVGERGLKLSGGEKQRVAIARTILKNPSILVFDEATSALDSHTEKEIHVSLEQVSQGRTTVVIAHRLSTVVDADEILVLVDGAIVERGTHLNLVGAGGVYAGMWAKQQETS